MSHAQKTKNLVSILLRIGLSAALLSYLFSKIDIPKTIDVLKNADYIYILYGLIIFFLINIMILIRWNIYIRALGLKVPLKSVINCFFIGLFYCIEYIFVI